MSAEEDTELRDLVAQTLETHGVLSTLRAQLRASVFLSLEEQESVQNKTPLLNKRLQTFVNTDEGRLVTGLVREFLEFFSLDYTAAVFEPETGSDVFTSRVDLARDLDIIESPGTTGMPLLAEVVRRSASQVNPAPHAHSEDLPPEEYEEARAKFLEYDTDDSGTIDKNELRNLFCDMFPDFNRNMLDRYVNEEFREYDKSFRASIDFDEFLDMYKRVFILSKSVVSQEVSSIMRHTGKTSPRTKSKQPATTTSQSSDTGKPDLPSTAPPPAVTTKRGGAGDLLLSTASDDAEDDSFFDEMPRRDRMSFNRSAVAAASDSSSKSTKPRRSNIPRKIAADRPGTSNDSTKDTAATPRDGDGAQTDRSAAYEYDEHSRARSPDDRSVHSIDKKFGDLGVDIPKDDDYDEDFESSKHMSSLGGQQTPRGTAHLSPRSARSDSVAASIPEEIDDALDEDDDDLSDANELLKDDNSARDDLTTDRTVSPAELSQAFDYAEQVAKT